jgi:hypothetical protein
MNTNNNKVSTTKVAHPCQYCGQQCFGSQCKNCHLKMMSEREGNCNDCSKTFPAMRKDGTMRIRCAPCQEVYNSTYIANCSGCGDDYNTKSKDGRFFDKCYSCYKKKFTKCKNCDGSTLVEYPLCKSCFVTDRAKKPSSIVSSSSSKSSSKKFDEHRCNMSGCTSMTTYFYCKPCSISSRQVSDTYMVSRCQYETCGQRFKGNYKYCLDHSETAAV